jgi:hypothetical protein
MLLRFDSTRWSARAIACALVFLAAVPVAWAQLTVHHEPPDCYPTEGYLIIRASIVSVDPANVAVRLYFRSEGQTSYDFVEMMEREEYYFATLPRPLETTARIEYYIESWDREYEVMRSKVYSLRVAGTDNSCEIDPALVLTGATPGIVVYSTSDVVAPQPAGFAPDGIAEYGHGEALGPRQSDSKKIVAGALATSLAVGTVAVLGSGGSSEAASPPAPDTEPPDPSPPAPSPPPPSASTEPVIACFDAPISALIGEQVRLDASCSQPREELDFDWELGDQRVRQGRVVNPIYRSPGTYEVALTVKRTGSDALIDRDRMTRQVEVVAPSVPTPSAPSGGASADVAIGVTGVLTPRIIVLGISYIITVANFGPSPATGVTVVDSLPSSLILNGVSGAFCTRTSPITCDLGSLPVGSTKTVTIDVTVDLGQVSVGDVVVNPVTVSASEADPRPANNRADALVQIALSQKTTDEGRSAFDTSLTSSLEGFDRVTQGSVLFNQQQVETVNSTSPVRHQLRGWAGRNVVQAYLSSPADADGVWRFDFTRTEHFQTGSIEVRQGRVLQQDGDHVVFRIGASPGERIEFTVELSP